MAEVQVAEAVGWVGAATALVAGIGIPIWRIWSRNRERTKQSIREHRLKLLDGVRRDFEALTAEHKTLQEKYLTAMVRIATLEAEAAARGGPIRANDPIS